MQALPQDAPPDTIGFFSQVQAALFLNHKEMQA